MSNKNWLTHFANRFGLTRKSRLVPNTQSKARRAALGMEFLEDRTVPSTFTRTSPTSGGLLPSGVTEVGGIVVDMVGNNGARIVSQVSAGSLWQGYATTTGNFGDPAVNPLTIGTQTGFTSTVTGALGGGN